MIGKRKSYGKKAIELMFIDPKIIGDWMEKYREVGEEAIKDVQLGSWRQGFGEGIQKASRVSGKDEGGERVL